jgi:type I pantothenate kinase
MTIAVDHGRDARALEVLARHVEELRPAVAPFIIAVTGSVAVGKSTFAAALAKTLRPGPAAAGLELTGTDGFLLPNAILDARGLTMRKGFPESFDTEALAAALTQIRRTSAVFPGYSHVTYDVDPALERRIDRPGVLIVEGLGLGPHRRLVDALIYLDASEADLEAWFVERFMRFWAQAEHEPLSFYARFRGLDRRAASDLARSVWGAINLPNLRQHIFPQRDLADIVVKKGADHEIVEIVGGHGQATRL